MAPQPDSDFSTDGLKTDLIPLIEWLQRSLEGLSLTSTDAADFASLMERGTLSAKGFPAVVSTAHASVLIRRLRTSPPGTFYDPVPWCHVADPSSAAPGALFDVNGSLDTSDMPPELVTHLVSLGGLQATNDGDAARNAAAAAETAAKDAAAISAAATASSAANATDLANAAIVARQAADTAAALVPPTLLPYVPPFFCGTGNDKKIYGQFCLAPEVIYRADEAGARLILSRINDPTRRDELRDACRAFGGGGLAMARYFYLEGRNLDIVQSGIALKNYRALCASPFADLEPSTIRRHYIELDVANKSLPDSKRHSTAELGEAMLSITLATSDDIFQQLEQKKDTRATLDSHFVATGAWVKDTLCSILLDRAQREQLARAGVTGAAKAATALPGTPAAASVVKRSRKGRAAAAGTGSVAADAKKTYDTKVKSTDAHGNPKAWSPDAGLCKFLNKRVDGKLVGCTDGKHWHKDCPSVAAAEWKANKSKDKESSPAPASGKAASASWLESRLDSLTSAVASLASLHASASPSVAPSVIGDGSPPSSIVAPSVTGSAGVASGVSGPTCAAAAFLNASAGETQSLTAEELFAFTSSSPPPSPPCSPTPPPGEDAGDEEMSEFSLSDSAFLSGHVRGGVPPKRSIYVVSTAGSLHGIESAGIWYSTTDAPDGLNLRVLGQKTLPIPGHSHGITSCATLYEAARICEERGVPCVLRGSVPYHDPISDTTYPVGCQLESRLLLSSASGHFTSADHADAGQGPPFKDTHPQDRDISPIVYPQVDGVVQLPPSIDRDAVHQACRAFGDSIFHLLSCCQGGDVFKPEGPNKVKASNPWLRDESPLWVRSLLTRDDVNVVGDQLKSLTWIMKFASCTDRQVSDSPAGRRTAVDAMRLHLTRLAVLLGGRSDAPIHEAIIPLSSYVLRAVRLARSVHQADPCAAGSLRLTMQLSSAFPHGPAGLLPSASTSAATIAAITTGLGLYHDPGARLALSVGTTAASNASLILPMASLFLLLAIFASVARTGLRIPLWQAKSLTAPRAETYRSRGDWSPQRPPRDLSSSGNFALVAPADSYRFPLRQRLQHSLNVGSPPWLLLMLVLLWLSASVFDAAVSLASLFGADLRRKRSHDVFGAAATLFWLRAGTARGVSHRSRTLLPTPSTPYQLARLPFSLLRFVLLHLGHRLSRGARCLLAGLHCIALDACFLANMTCILLDDTSATHLALLALRRLARGGVYLFDCYAHVISIAPPATTTPICARIAVADHGRLLPAAAISASSLTIAYFQALCFHHTSAPAAPAHASRFSPGATCRLNSRTADTACPIAPMVCSNHSRFVPQRCAIRNRRRCFALLGKKGHASLTSLVSPDGSKIGIPAVVDSGCTFHAHPHLRHLTNVRDCNDILIDAQGVEHLASKIGDLRAIAKDSKGRPHAIILRNVRHVPTFVSTLLSVDQLWDENGLDSRFRSDMRHLSVDASSSGLGHRHFPMGFREGLFVWDLLPRDGRVDAASSTSNPPSCALNASGYHRPSDGERFSRLPSDLVAQYMHMRLHGGIEAMRRLSTMVSDAPPSIAKNRHASCPHCVEANATRHSHGGDAYAPSHAGRLIHADIAGPFRPSVRGSSQYALILVDDHTRFKYVAFLKRKADALLEIKRFVAFFNAAASAGKPEPVRVVGSLRTDNAGEFLSHDMSEYLAEQSIDHTTCPPHVHQLNGVAERAIRSIMSRARALMTASGAPVGFWPQAVAQSVEILNRTTGPPQSAVSSYELLYGQRPRIMSILPFGCQMFAVKPLASVSKTDLETKAWEGINLGCTSGIPHSYDVWIPRHNKVVSTSDVYYNENYFPWRKPGDRLQGPSVPHPVELIDPAPEPVAPTSDHAPVVNATSPVSPESMPEAYAQATLGADAPAKRSRKALILFSGSYDRSDGLAAMLSRYGIRITVVDNDPISGGGPAHSVLNDSFYRSLLARVQSGEYFAVFAAPPCSTFSISRFFHSTESTDGGPPPVRDRHNIRGIPGIPSAHVTELNTANAVVDRTVALLDAARRAGAEFVMENPADRGNSGDANSYIDGRHGPVWLMPEVIGLSERVGCQRYTFPQCSFGAPALKLTTLLCSPGFCEHFKSLSELKCRHLSHEGAVGGKVSPEGWDTAKSSAYPAGLNHFIAQGFCSLIDLRDSVGARRPPLTLRDSTAVVGDRFTGEVEASAPLADSGTRGPPRPPLPPQADFEPTPPAPLAPAPPSPLPSPLPVPLPSSSSPPTSDSETDDESPTPPYSRHANSPFKATRDGRGLGRQATRSSKPTLAGPLGSSFMVKRAASSRRMPKKWLRNEGYSTIGFAHQARAGPNDPVSQKDAYRRDRVKWRASEQDELDNHHSNGSWTLIDRSEVPAGRKLIRLIWVYKVKRNGKFKSRLCVQGCAQVPGVDYDQTFSAAMRSTSLRLLSSIAARLGLNMHRWDFVAAYLQGTLLDGEVVYCHMPPGYETIGKDGRQRVCRVEKPIYGMAQAGRRWQRSLFPWLVEWGFTQCHSDPCVFTCSRTMQTPDGPRDERLILGCYVDDLFTLHSHEDEHSLYHQFTCDLLSKWNVEDEGEISDLLGVEISREGSCVVLRQTAYIDRLVSEHLPDGIAVAFDRNKVPASPDGRLKDQVINAMCQAEDSINRELRERYQSLVGALLYCATNTRPDIAYAVGLLCRAMSRPSIELYESALDVLRYLHRHRDIGLRYESDQRPLRGLSDSDWGTQRSTTGYVFSYNSAAISWASKKQDTVSLSSCEAEIMAASEAAKEGIYLSNFLEELDLALDEPLELGTDNTGARDLSYNPEHHQRTKHIERRHFFIRECVENMRISVPYVNTHDNLADFFTKALKPQQFFAMRDAIMNAPTRHSHNPLHR